MNKQFQSHIVGFSAGATLVLFVALLAAVWYKFPAVTLLDEFFGNLVRLHIPLSALTPMLVITNIASPFILGSISLVAYSVLVWYRRGYYDVVFMGSMFFGVVLTYGLKWFLAVPRPPAAFTATFGGSFPSGHTTMATIVFLVLAYAFRHEIRNVVVRWVFELGCFLFILAIVCSRIFLGAHRPSEVAAGFLLGVFCVSVSLVLFHPPASSRVLEEV